MMDLLWNKTYTGESMNLRRKIKYSEIASLLKHVSFDGFCF